MLQCSEVREIRRNQQRTLKRRGQGVGETRQMGCPRSHGRACFQGEGVTGFQVSTAMRTVECRWPGGLEGR